jgi:hypothetical protein
MNIKTGNEWMQEEIDELRAGNQLLRQQFDAKDDEIARLYVNLEQKAQTCLWTLDDEESGTWASSCGELWSFIDGGPTENRVTYCHHCGNVVRND